MSRIVLVFTDEDDEDERVEYTCDRLQLQAHEVEPGDFVACPHTGFVHVHEVSINEGIVYLCDCYDHEHLYSLRTTLEVARPVADSRAQEHVS